MKKHCLLALNAAITALLSCADAPSQHTTFVDITIESGLDFQHQSGATGQYYYPETFGSGAAVFDFDGDGFLDLYLLNGGRLPGVEDTPAARDALYRNLGRNTVQRSQQQLEFADISASSLRTPLGYGMGAAAADYDNDGDSDLYLTRVGSNVLLRNDGNTLVDVAPAAGVNDARWGTSTGFLDYDNDGDLDIFAANYVAFSAADHAICQRGSIRTYCEPTSYAPTNDLLYRNDGEHFSEVAFSAGIKEKGRGLGAAFSDYDLDGDTDIYVANDGQANFLYVNEDGVFIDRGLERGGRFNSDGRAEAGMGVDWGDFDNDGWPDLLATNFSYETHTLYRNKNGTLRDITQSTGLDPLSYTALGFGCFFFDYDNDGLLDLFVANGHVLDQIARVDSSLSYAQTDQVLRNINGEHFIDISAELGIALRQKHVSRAALKADFDNDGDLDILVTATDAPPRLLRNDATHANHWLAVALFSAPYHHALGARVTVTTPDRRMQRQRQSGGSYLSASDSRLYFGLGSATTANIEIHWPDGTQQMLENIAADQILSITQLLPEQQ